MPGIWLLHTFEKDRRHATSPNLHFDMSKGNVVVRYSYPQHQKIYIMYDNDEPSVFFIIFYVAEIYNLFFFEEMYNWFFFKAFSIFCLVFLVWCLTGCWIFCSSHNTSVLFLLSPRFVFADFFKGQWRLQLGVSGLSAQEWHTAQQSQHHCN